jgi:hypothetical protein
LTLGAGAARSSLRVFQGGTNARAKRGAKRQNAKID